MQLRKSYLLSAMCVFSIVVLSFALSAQDNLDDLKAEWRSGKYQTVLQPLMQYRDSANRGATFEVDYMIGTTLCHWPEFKASGCEYLRGLRTTYPSHRFDDRPVDLHRVILSYCGSDPGPVVSENTDESAGVDGKADRPGSHAMRSPTNIRDGIKRKRSLAQEMDIDRAGQDYRDFDLSEARFELCRDVCANEAECRAFTYVKPAYQGANARCWLKSGVPKPAANGCCISGVK
jgi:hypothetical protein